jgi:hypothetical protein
LDFNKNKQPLSFISSFPYTLPKWHQLYEGDKINIVLTTAEKRECRDTCDTLFLSLVSMVMTSCTLLALLAF